MERRRARRRTPSILTVLDGKQIGRDLFKRRAAGGGQHTLLNNITMLAYGWAHRVRLPAATLNGAANAATSADVRRIQ
jgi:hypothetical protein